MTSPLVTFGRQVSREIKPDVEIKEEDEEELEEVSGRVDVKPATHEAPTKHGSHLGCDIGGAIWS